MSSFFADQVNIFSSCLTVQDDEALLFEIQMQVLCVVLMVWSYNVREDTVAEHLFALHAVSEALNCTAKGSASEHYLQVSCALHWNLQQFEH